MLLLYMWGPWRNSFAEDAQVGSGAWGDSLAMVWKNWFSMLSQPYVMQLLLNHCLDTMGRWVSSPLPHSLRTVGKT